MKKILLMFLMTFIFVGNMTAEAQDANNTVDRYVKLFSDNGFTYYMDSKSAKWTPCPSTNEEYMVDVWIKLVRDGEVVEADTAAPDAEIDPQYSYPAKYYLEHYYMRPDREQIQFLSEIEVAGRPDNDIKEKEYDVANWEKLVPDSIEDNIYHRVMDEMKALKKSKNKQGGNSIKDTIENVLRISI